MISLSYFEIKHNQQDGGRLRAFGSVVALAIRMAKTDVKFDPSLPDRILLLSPRFHNTKAALVSNEPEYYHVLRMSREDEVTKPKRTPKVSHSV